MVKEKADIPRTQSTTPTRGEIEKILRKEGDGPRKGTQN